MVDFLASNGANFRMRNHRDDTPLHKIVYSALASPDKEIDVARALIKHGVDINDSSQETGTALHWSAGLGKLYMTKLLISKGADIEARTKNGGVTPLFDAARNFPGINKIAIVDLLLQHGANIHARASDGLTALGKLYLEESHDGGGEGADDKEGRKRTEMMRFLESKGAVTGSETE